MTKIAKMELAKLRVLLVDNAPANVELVRRGLSQAAELPFEVRWAGDLAEAFRQLRLDACFDVVLLNLTLPNCWGLGSLQLLRQRCRNIPVLVLTGVPDETTAPESVELGDQDFLVMGKVSAKALIRSIRFAIQRQQYLAAAAQYDVELEAVGSLASAVEPCPFREPQLGFAG